MNSLYVYCFLNLENNTNFFLVLIKKTPVKRIAAAIIDCWVICSFKKNQPSSKAITGFTYVEVATFSGETALNK